MNEVDVIVVGGGHAGTEAAAAAARIGARTLLVNFDRARIGAMSCNPAIGGLGKGHIVREVDAFDGLIARAADAAGIHYRMLNRSKGTAVQGPRVQADRKRFAAAIQVMLDEQTGLHIIEGEVEAIIRDRSGFATGIKLATGAVWRAKSVVLATGTFLGGRMFRGEERVVGGRVGEAAATYLALQLREADLPMARLKTGTPPRLDGRTIDWAVLQEQPSDDDHWTMSPMSPRRSLPQLRCAITRTTRQTHDVVRESLHRSPLWSGDLAGAGPRYCPSIEDKIHRFGDRDGHQIFLEPEGLDVNTVYPNGISTSLPADVQRDMIATIPGLAQARIVTDGYAVEYDHVDPRALDATLQLRQIPGLFCCGQINGTTGYEEAAGQGLIAGLNAALRALGRAPLMLDRATSYIGVMIDDLVLQGVTEPYRMLTARAEYRLRLRADNAETRLGPVADAIGCLSAERRRRLQDRMRTRQSLRDDLQNTVSPIEIAAAGGPATTDGVSRSGYEWFRIAGVEAHHVLRNHEAPDEVLAEVVEDARYAPYLARQDREIEQLRANDAIALPDDLSFETVPGLSGEMVERLTRARPDTLGAASRIRGITPAALTAILLQTRRKAA